jgi:hypothetical protein
MAFRGVDGAFEVGIRIFLDGFSGTQGCAFQWTCSLPAPHSGASEGQTVRHISSMVRGLARAVKPAIPCAVRKVRRRARSRAIHTSPVEALRT